MSAPLRVLILTRLFPNAADPGMAPFNRQQFSALARVARVHLLATIPWFPGARFFAGRSLAGRHASAPARELIDGLPVEHPRTLFVPRVGHALAPALYAASVWRQVARLRGELDVILGSWAWPDGAAAALLGGRLGVPVVVKVHGSDVYSIARRPTVRPLLRAALRRVRRVVAVSRALASEVAALGVEPARISLVPNGVDRALFRPRDRAQARTTLGVPPGPLVLYVGRLERAKGVPELLQAFAVIGAKDPTARLALVGAGSLMGEARALGERLHGRVHAPGVLPLPEVANWMAAADLVTLPSRSEGTPNVLLEALASGRPLVATRVGGIPDVISDPALGRMVEAGDVAGLAAALSATLKEAHDPQRLAAAAPPDWSESAGRLLEVLQSAVRGG